MINVSYVPGNGIHILLDFDGVERKIVSIPINSVDELYTRKRILTLMAIPNPTFFEMDSNKITSFRHTVFATKKVLAAVRFATN